MKKIASSLLPAIFLWLQPAVFAQDVAPDDATAAMTLDAGEPIISNDPANNEDVPGDPSFRPPDLPTLDGPVNSDYEGPIGVTGIFNGNVATGCSYDPLGHSSHRAVDDIVVPNSIGKYPLKMTRYYNSRQQYYAGGAIALSPGWAHEYSWLQGSGYIPKLISPHGNVHDAFCGLPVGVSESWDGDDWRLADGGRVHFDTILGRATWIEDPYGQRTTITYSNSRISQVTEPGGRYLSFFYGPAADPDGTVLLTRVEAHGLGNATVTDWVNYSYTPVSAGVQGRDKMMLTRADYPYSNPNNLEDNTHAHYEYRTDNVTEGPTIHKMYPLLQRCDDVRYNGPMRTVRYEYDNGGPHGAIINEKYPGGGSASAISPRAGVGDTFTETRGDGPTRSFTYTHMMHCHGPECGPCDDVLNSNPPQQMLTSYTDFQGRTTTLGYDSNWYINSVTDANNRTTTYQRGAPPPTGIGQITRITHPGGAHIDYTYYNEGSGHIGGHYINSVTDERGNKTAHTRDARYRITRTDYKDSNNNILASETFSYCDQVDSQCNNTFGQLKTHRLKNGAYVHYQYDSRGRLAAKWNPTTNPTAQSGDPKTTYSYWNNATWADRVYQMTLPANGSNQVAYERYEYDRNASGAACPGRGLVTKITHADGKYQSFGYNQFGNKMWEENELRQRTSYAYDNYSRVLSITKPLIGTETFNYLKPGTSSAYLHTTNSVYTHTSRTGIVTNNVYDQNWRKTSTTEASGTLNLTTRFAYDYVGNLTDVTDPRSKVTVNVYDGRNRKTSTTEASGTTLARTTVWHYDGASNINRIDRADGRTETKGFDALNRVTWHNMLRQVAGNDPVNVRTSFFYNPSGTIEHVTDPNGKNTSFLYDASDRKTRMTYHDNSCQSWAYDNAGNLASRTTVSNKTQSFTYDKRNRKTGMSWTNGVDSGSFTYDDASRLLIATSPNSTVTRTYNAVGWLTVDQQYPTSLPGGARTVNYSYDDDGKVTRTYVGSASYDYDFSYDAMGRFEKIFVHGSANPSFQYYYDSASNETQRRTYLSTGVNMDKLTPRDSLNRMARRDLKINGTPFSAEAYVYDRMDRLVEVNRGSVSDLFGWYWDGQLYWAQYGFQQDMPSQEGEDPDMDTRDNVDPYANYQPPEVEEPEPPAPPENYAELPLGGVAQPESYQRWVTYLLDRGGNRMQVVDTSSGTANYTRNTINQYTAVTGCMVTNGAEHEVSLFKAPTDAQQVNYYYINDERLKQVTSGSNTYDLKYDALGRCVKRTLNGTTTYYIYDGEKPVVEYNSSGTVIARNVYGKGIDEILTRTETGINGGQPFYYGDDHEGSVTHLLDRNGNKIEIYKYDVFGAPTFYNGSGTQITSTAYNNRFLFTGREYAATYRGTYVAPLAFYEYRARAYNPILGRFMSEDPKLFDAGDYNFFRYCHNDPVDKTDPTGLIDEGHMESAELEATVQGSQRLLQSIGHDIAREYREQGPFVFFSNAAMILSKGGPKIEGGGLRGVRDPRPTIIGNNQEGRVVPFAKATNARTIDNGKTQAEWHKMSAREQYKAIDGAVRQRASEGSTFRDIGWDGQQRLIDGRKIELNRLNLMGIPVEKAPASEIIGHEIEAPKLEIGMGVNRSGPLDFQRPF